MFTFLYFVDKFATKNGCFFSMMIIAAMEGGDEINIGNSAESSSMIVKQLKIALGKENMHTKPLFFCISGESAKNEKKNIPKEARGNRHLSFKKSLHEKVYWKRSGPFYWDRRTDRRTDGQTIKVLRTSLIGDLTVPCSEV